MARTLENAARRHGAAFSATAGGGISVSTSEAATLWKAAAFNRRFRKWERPHRLRSTGFRTKVSLKGSSSDPQERPSSVWPHGFVAA
jgi:hypothetical protein